MALLGPNVDAERIKDPSYDQCSMFFDLNLDQTGESTYDYGKLVDMECNQRSRALMCTLLGIFYTFYQIIVGKISYSTGRTEVPGL